MRTSLTVQSREPALDSGDNRCQLRFRNFIVGKLPFASPDEQSAPLKQTKLLRRDGTGDLASGGQFAYGVSCLNNELQHFEAMGMSHRFQAFGGFRQLLGRQRSLFSLGFHRFKDVSLIGAYDRVECTALSEQFNACA